VPALTVVAPRRACTAAEQSSSATPVVDSASHKKTATRAHPDVFVTLLWLRRVERAESDGEERSRSTDRSVGRSSFLGDVSSPEAVVALKTMGFVDLYPRKRRREVSTLAAATTAAEKQRRHIEAQRRSNAMAARELERTSRHAVRGNRETGAESGFAADADEADVKHRSSTFRLFDGGSRRRCGAPLP